VRQQACRIILEQHDIGCEPGAATEAFQKIVTEDAIFRDLRVDRGAESVDVVDALAGKDAFSEQILLHVGHSMRVKVERNVAGIDSGEGAGGTCGGICLDAGLDDAVTLVDPSGFRVDHSSVQWM